MLEEAVADFIKRQRVARLATATKEGRPHIIPICFTFDAGQLYTAIDEKPKRASPTGLRRIRNILANPRVAVLFDVYDEDWRRLRFVLASGRAELLSRGAEWRKAVRLLRAKYPLYRKGYLTKDPLVIQVVPEHVYAWGFSRREFGVGLKRGGGRATSRSPPS